MRILFVADGRSPIALNWIRYFIEHGDAVHLASTFPCAPVEGLTGLYSVPVAFSQLKSATPAGEAPARRRGAWSGRLAGMRTRLRQWLGPLTLGSAARRLRAVLDQVQPDLLHAMRIPYEGMLAALTVGRTGDPPLLVSVWGNDFTLHATSNPWMAGLTRRTLRAAQALHADCQRDIRLGMTWGFSAHGETLVLPGGGGVQADVFYPAQHRPGPVVINPRGFRAYVRNDTFFAAIPRVLAALPQARFLCVGMAGDQRTQETLANLGVAGQVDLLPAQTRAQMADLFRAARVAVSPTTHDGTPNTLLEAMACGCLPVAGDLESLREWITPGENGLLVDPGDPAALTQAILQGLEDEALYQRARQTNIPLIASRAEYGAVMQQAAEAYVRIARLKPGNA